MTYVNHLIHNGMKIGSIKIVIVSFCSFSFSSGWHSPYTNWQEIYIVDTLWPHNKIPLVCSVLLLF